MNRRGFLGACLVAAAAPAIVRADSLMRIVPREATVIVGIDFSATLDETVFHEYQRHIYEMCGVNDRLILWKPRTMGWTELVMHRRTPDG